MPRSGRPSVLDNEALHTMLEVQTHASTRELSAALDPSKDTINRHLHQLDFVYRRPREDPHDLTTTQAQRQVGVCKQLLENPLDDRF